MFKAKHMLLVLMLGMPAIASAGSPFDAMHERHVSFIKKVHFGDDRRNEPRYHDRRDGRHYDGWGDAEINRMQHVQQKTIQQGVRSGELTRGEVQRLQMEQQRVAKLESRYKADGHLSHSERRNLERELNKVDRRIYNEMHDKQDRR